ncbi:MAG: hypothetical protein DMF25_11480, partial [Verrucomicrobia bacterium]
MKNLTKTISMLAVGLLSYGLFCQQAQAITGDIEFTGKTKASGASGAGTTTISFKNPGWKVFAGTGGYSAVTFGTATTFSNFRFTGDGTGATLTGPVNPQWSFVFGGKTYTFELLALTSGHVQSGSMAFTGTGTAFINGGGPSPANWSLQGSTGKGFTFTLSSSTTGAVSAPDGGSAVALLGIAFAGIEGVRRSIRARKHNRENGENGEKGASKNVIHRRHRNPTEYGKYKTCCYFAVNLLKPFSQNMSGNHSTLNVGSATRKKQFKSNLSVLVPCLVFFLQSNALAIPITG